MLVLVVDDIENNRLILSRFLLSKNYEVLEASSGEASIALIKDNDIDLVLMDIKMPFMDGYAAASKIKSLKNEEYIPIIFVSAISEEDALEEALASGGDDYVSKPVNFEALYSKIKAHERIRKLHAELNAKNNELNKHNIRLKREHELISHFFDHANEHCYLNEDVAKFKTIAMETFNGDTVLIGKRSHGGVTILVGDFTGHGLSAAVGTLPVSQIFFKMLEDNAFIGDIAKELNKQISVLLPIEMFFAASLIELSAKGDRLMVWHGGIPDAYLIDESSREIKEVKSQHLPLGVRTEQEFDDSVQLFYVGPQHKFIVFTDGLTEAVNLKNKMISTDVYKEAIVNGENPLESVLNSYYKYSEGTPQRDDISVLELSCVAVERDIKEDKIISDFHLPWKIELNIENENLGKEVVQDIIDLIGCYSVLKESKGVIHTLLTEMYTNAVDHGILEMDGGDKDSSEAFDDYYNERAKLISELKNACVKVNIDFTVHENAPLLTISIAHDGSGFDSYVNEIADDDLHGRGMLLIDAICKEVNYSDEGRCLTVIVEL